MTTQTAPMHGWQLEEGSATAYERFLVPVFFDPWARDLVDAAEIERGQAVLDVACGTGIVSRHAAARVGQDGTVAGADLNPSMLAVARHAAAGIRPAIRFEQASADALPFPESTFDAVLCQQGLQFFADRPAALVELARVLKAGGRLAVSTCRALPHQPGYRILTDVLRRHVGVRAAEMIRSPFALGEASQVRGLVSGAGFRVVHARVAVWTARFASAEAFLRGETASSPLGGLVGQLDADVTTTLLADLTDRLAPHTDDDGVVFPFETLVVTALR